jgi:hypothetical protein
VTAPDDTQPTALAPNSCPLFDSKQKPGANQVRPRSEARGNVAKADNSGWSLYGAQRSQPVATGSKRDGAENGSPKRKPLPSVANSCLSRSMVRRGSTVRVRQRALQKPRESRLSLSINLHDVHCAVGMEPLMELLGLECLSRCLNHSDCESPGCRPPAARSGPKTSSRVMRRSAHPSARSSEVSQLRR